MRRDAETLVTIASSTQDFGTVSVAVGPEHCEEVDLSGGRTTTYAAGPLVVTVHINASGVTMKGVFPECTTVVKLSSGRARTLSAALLVAAEILDRESER